MHTEYDGAIIFLCECSDSAKHRTNLISSIHVYLGTEICLQRVEDHQQRIQILHDLLYSSIVGQTESFTGFVVYIDMIEIWLHTFEARLDCVCYSVLCRLIYRDGWSSSSAFTVKRSAGRYLSS